VRLFSEQLEQYSVWDKSSTLDLLPVSSRSLTEVILDSNSRALSLLCTSIPLFVLRDGTDDMGGSVRILCSGTWRRSISDDREGDRVWLLGLGVCYFILLRCVEERARWRVCTHSYLQCSLRCLRS
jgi:hypothetical protein